MRCLCFFHNNIFGTAGIPYLLWLRTHLHIYAVFSLMTSESCIALLLTRDRQKTGYTLRYRSWLCGPAISDEHIHFWNDWHNAFSPLYQRYCGCTVIHNMTVKALLVINETLRNNLTHCVEEPFSIIVKILKLWRLSKWDSLKLVSSLYLMLKNCYIH